MVELRQLRHFLAVYDCGSIREAARRIPLSPSALTRSIQLVEEHYGVPLLSREARRMTPTAYGHEVAREARRILTDISRIDERVSDLADVKRGHLRVGISPACMNAFYDRATSRLFAAYPAVRLETSVGEVRRQIAWLEHHEIDVAIAIEPPLRTLANAEVRTLHEDRPAFFARKGHPLAKAKGLSAGELAEYPIFSQIPPPQYENWLRAFFTRAAEQGVDAGLAHQVTYYPLLLRQAARSDAIVLGPSRDILACPCAEGLVRLDIAEDPGTFRFGMAFLRVPPPPPSLLRFCEFCLEAAAEVERIPID